MAAFTIHPTADRPHPIRLPLLAATAALASIAGVAAAVTLIRSDDPAVEPAVVVLTPFQATNTEDQLGAELEAMVAAITGLVDPTEVQASAPGSVAPSDPTGDPVAAETFADLQSGAVGLSS